MTHPLDGCRLKIDRARQHLEELETLINRFIREDHPNGIKIHLDHDRREGSLTFFIGEEPRAEWGIMVGEILYRLHSVLDHLVWQLVIVNGQIPSDNTGFPVFDNESRYKSGRAKKIAGVCDKAAAVIDGLQPFITGESESHQERLWILYKLSNIDKHRVLHLSRFFLKTAEYKFSHPPDIRVETIERMERGPLEDGTVLARFRWTRSAGANGKMGVQFGLSFDVTFKEPPTYAEPGIDLTAFPVVDSLRQLLDRVENGVLPKFDRFFR
jgi:hypothetical protein